MGIELSQWQAQELAQQTEIIEGKVESTHFVRNYSKWQVFYGWNGEYAADAGFFIAYLDDHGEPDLEFLGTDADDAVAYLEEVEKERRGDDGDDDEFMVVIERETV